MARKYTLKKRLDKSYKAYLKKRKELKSKGFALIDKLSRYEYGELYLDAKDAGLSNNFARTMAYDDLHIKGSQSREIFRQMDYGIKEKYGIWSAKELRGADDIHAIITDMFDSGLIDNRDEFEKSLGY